MADAKQYRNYAFISYKRSDEKWAKWLQQKLESYQLPSSLKADNPEVPSTLRPIFRDKTDIGVGVLQSIISQELSESKYLIVICSPRSASSKWVNREIEEFLSTHDKERIIPFIIEGHPSATNPEEACFPPALKHAESGTEILGININEIGKEQAFIKMVSTLLGLRFDVLWQRHERARKRRNTIIYTALSLLFAIFLFAALFFRHQNIRLTETQNNLLVSQSRYITKEALSLLKANRSLTAARLLLNVLPENTEAPNRPFVPEAAKALDTVLDSLLYNNYQTNFYEANDRFWSANSTTQSPDGSLVVVTYADGSLEIFDGNSGKTIKQLPTYNDYNNSSLRISDDNKWLLSIAKTASSVNLLNLDNWTEKTLSNEKISKIDIAEFAGKDQDLSVIIAGNSTICQQTIDGTILHTYTSDQDILSVIIDQRKKTLDYVITGIKGIQFSLIGTYAEEQNIYKVDPSKDKLSLVLSNAQGSNHIFNSNDSIVYSQNKGIVYYCDLIKKETKIYDQQYSKQKLQLFDTSIDTYNEIKLVLDSEDKHLLCLGTDSTIYFRDAKTMDVLWSNKYAYPLRKAWFIDKHQDIGVMTTTGQILTIDKDNGEIIKAVECEEVSILPIKEQTNAQGTKLAYISKNNTPVMVSISDDQYNYNWLELSKEEFVSDIDYDEPSGIAIFATNNKRGILYNLKKGELKKTVKIADNLSQKVYCAIADDRNYAIATDSLFIYEDDELKHLYQLDSNAEDISYSPDKKELAIVDQDNKVWLFNTHPVELKDTISLPKHLKTSIFSHSQNCNNIENNKLAYNTTGDKIAVATNDTIYIIDRNRNNAIDTLPCNLGEEEVTALCFSPNGETLASAAGDKTIRFWNVDTKEEISRWEEIPILYEIKYSKDNKHLICSGRKSALVYDLNSGEMVNRYDLNGMNNIFYSLNWGIPIIETDTPSEIIAGGYTPCIRKIRKYEETRSKLIEIIKEYSLTEDEQYKYFLR